MVSKPKFRLRFGVPSCWVGLTLSLSLSRSSLFLSPLSSLLLFAYYSIFFSYPDINATSVHFHLCFSFTVSLSLSLWFPPLQIKLYFPACSGPFLPSIHAHTHTHTHQPFNPPLLFLPFQKSHPTSLYIFIKTLSLSLSLLSFQRLDFCLAFFTISFIIL